MYASTGRSLNNTCRTPTHNINHYIQKYVVPHATKSFRTVNLASAHLHVYCHPLGLLACLISICSRPSLAAACAHCNSRFQRASKAKCCAITDYLYRSTSQANAMRQRLRFRAWICRKMTSSCMWFLCVHGMRPQTLKPYMPTLWFCTVVRCAWVPMILYRLWYWDMPLRHTHQPLTCQYTPQHPAALQVSAMLYYSPNTTAHINDCAAYTISCGFCVQIGGGSTLTLKACEIYWTLTIRSTGLDLLLPWWLHACHC